MTKRLKWAIIILSLAGIADTAYLSYARLADSPLSCSILEGCNTVATSEHSVLFGVPLAYLGFVFYVAVFVIGILIFIKNSNFARGLLFLVASLGLALSVYFFYLQALVIEAFCVYCLISAVISALLFFVALRIWKAAKEESSGVFGENF